jgi:hypothetical protein
MRVGLFSAALLISVVACGQVEPVILAVSMPECTSSKLPPMREGRLSLSLTLNGIAHSGVAVAELTEGHTYDELLEHVTAGADVWERRPDWLKVRAELELSSAQGLDGVEETVFVESGDYAVVCLDHDTESGTRMQVEAPLSVRAG